MFNDKPVLDVHSHLRHGASTEAYLQTLMTYIQPALGKPGPIANGKSSDKVGLRNEDFQEAGERHLKILDDRLIDVQILGPHPVEINGWMPWHIFEPWIRHNNDCVYKMVQMFPDRWVGACNLPQRADAPDTEHCIPELERCVSEYGFAATYITPDITGRRDTPGVHDPYWYPVYEKCQELSIPIIVHGTDGLDPRYVGMPFPSILHFASEQFLATYLYRHSDVLDRFPELKICVCHCGGGLDRFIPTSPWGSQPPNRPARVGQMYYDTAVYDLEYLALGIKRRGLEHMVFGIETPGSGTGAIDPASGLPSDHLVEFIRDRPEFDFMSDEDKETLFYHNPGEFCPALLDPREWNARATATAD
jgi:predicted TIM-barrel fold metal-dependent hydrolase